MATELTTTLFDFDDPTTWPPQLDSGGAVQVLVFVEQRGHWETMELTRDDEADGGCYWRDAHGDFDDGLLPEDGTSIRWAELPAAPFA